MIPIHEKIKDELIKRIVYLQKKIDAFCSPIGPDDYKDRFHSRIHGDKSGKALTKFYDEKQIRENELSQISKYIYYFEK